MLIIFYLLKMIFTTGLISFRIVMYAFEYVFFHAYHLLKLST